MRSELASDYYAGGIFVRAGHIDPPFTRGLLVTRSLGAVVCSTPVTKRTAATPYRDQ
jgi:hypothetical protein